MIQSRGFLGRLVGPLLKRGLPLIKKVIKPLIKSVLIPLGSNSAVSAADTGVQKKFQDQVIVILDRLLRIIVLHLLLHVII